jgi:L-alanine-DL-glutamate epimerase-like enolase superfamily enzyme
MRWLGLRDFKLKVGLGEDVDKANLEVVTGQIGKAIRRGKCTLRVDVNGGWGVEQTPERISELAAAGVCAVEQPVYVPADELVALSRRCSLPLIADESLLTVEDGQVLSAAGERIWWNIRISKNGGLSTCMALARMAAEAGAPLIVGCMVGETSLLSAAQRALLQLMPAPPFVEGNYGRFLLKGDLVRRKVMMGYGGRLRALSRGRLTRLQADGALLERFATHVARLEARGN